MGAGASLGLAVATREATEHELVHVIAGLPPAQLRRLAAALNDVPARVVGQDVNLTVRLLSGRSLPTIRAEASWPGRAVKLEIARHLDKGSCVKSLHQDERELADGQTLEGFGFASGAAAELQAVVGRAELHPFWRDFRRYSGYPHDIARILIADYLPQATITAQMISRGEMEWEDDGDHSLGRAQFLLMATDTDSCKNDGCAVEILAIPPGSSHSSEQLLVDLCRLRNIDVVIVGSGRADASGDPQLVAKVKAAFAAAGVQVLVFGPSASIDAPHEPVGGWHELSTNPPPGVRIEGVNCLSKCNDLSGEPVQGEITEHMTAVIIGPKDEGRGYPAASWIRCAGCGGTASPHYPPVPSVSGLFGFMLLEPVVPGYFTKFAFVFCSSLPAAGEAAFALVLDEEEDPVVRGVESKDGTWRLRETEAEDGDDDKQNPYLQKLKALCFEDMSAPGPGQPITIQMYEMRKGGDPESGKGQYEDEDEEDENDFYRVDLKTGTWLGSRHGMQWEDGEMWKCLDVVKLLEEEEEE